MPTKITFFFYLSYVSNVLFCNRILSYFAKPNFIIYDEWFDDNLDKTKLDVKNRKIKTISNMHEFFYKHSNYKVGASENNFQLDIKVNKKELTNKSYLKNTSDKDVQLSIKKFRFFEKRNCHLLLLPTCWSNARSGAPVTSLGLGGMEGVTARVELFCELEFRITKL